MQVWIQRQKHFFLYAYKKPTTSTPSQRAVNPIEPKEKCVAYTEGHEPPTLLSYLYVLFLEGDSFPSLLSVCHNRQSSENFLSWQDREVNWRQSNAEQTIVTWPLLKAYQFYSAACLTKCSAGYQGVIVCTICQSTVHVVCFELQEFSQNKLWLHQSLTKYVEFYCLKTQWGELIIYIYIFLCVHVCVCVLLFNN